VRYIKAIFVDGKHACVIYDIVTKDNLPNIPCVEWIKINNNKVASTELKFNKNSMLQVMQYLQKEKA
jgi:hypothetical protein